MSAAKVDLLDNLRLELRRGSLVLAVLAAHSLTTLGSAAECSDFAGIDSADRTWS